MNSPKNVIRILLGVILIIAIFGIYFYKNKVPNSAPAEISNEQSKAENGLTVAVFPPDNWNSSTWSFNIKMDTHTVGINGDMLKSAKIIDDNGNQYTPTAWDGGTLSGHHAEGNLQFNAISPLPKRVKLVITNIDEVSERIFEWNL